MSITTIPEIGFRVRLEDLTEEKGAREVGVLRDLRDLGYEGLRFPSVAIVSLLVDPEGRGLVSMDEPMEGTDQTFYSYASLMNFWAASKAMALSTKALSWLRGEYAAAKDKRYEAMKKRPIGLTGRWGKQGAIVFANFSGSHEKWKDAFLGALVRQYENKHPDLGLVGLLNRLSQVAASVALSQTTRYELPGMSTRSVNVQNDIFRQIRNGFLTWDNLRPLYVIANLPHDDIAYKYMEAVRTFLKKVVWALGDQPREEGANLVDLDCKRHLYSLVANGRLPLVEIITFAQRSDTESIGALGYTMMQFGTEPNERHDYYRPVSIALSLRGYLGFHENSFLSPMTVFHSLLHEIAHLLDPEGFTTGRTDHHDIQFHRAFQFLYNVALGLPFIAPSDLLPVRVKWDNSKNMMWTLRKINSAFQRLAYWSPEEVEAWVYDFNRKVWG
jgi:hypothetical protein